ncbi:MAG: ZIP family metal transporter [Candidatus Nanohaloarchaea archaeon]
MVLETVVVSLVLTSVFSALGAFFLFVSRQDFERLTPYLISLAAGTIFGGVFIHLVFRLAASGYTRFTGLVVMVGLVGSFLLERAVHWHCHHTEGHEEPLPYVLAAGDAVHNVLDGLLIATSFLASASTGWAVTVAVVAHKIPKELGDFGIMVNGGFSRTKALGFNIGVSVFMFAGAAVVLGLSQLSSSTVGLLLPLVIGNFVYIAGSDLLPEFKSRDNWYLHLGMFLVGVGVMYAIPYLKALV